jgi:hypothetical protein
MSACWLSREPGHVVRDACGEVAGRTVHRGAVVFTVARDQAIGMPARVEVTVSASRFDHCGGMVLPAPLEAGESGASFTFAATVGSLWRATPQTGQRLRCAEFSWPFGDGGVGRRPRVTDSPIANTAAAIVVTRVPPAAVTRISTLGAFRIDASSPTGP